MSIKEKVHDIIDQLSEPNINLVLAYLNKEFMAKNKSQTSIDLIEVKRRIAIENNNETSFTTWSQIKSKLKSQ